MLSAESVVLPVPDRPKKIAASPLGPTFAEQCIGSTSLGRQHVVEIAEHRLLDLAGVFGAADQHQLLGEIDEDEGVGTDAVDLVLREEMRRVQDGEIGHVSSCSSSALGRMNMLRANSACQADGVATRTFSR